MIVLHVAFGNIGIPVHRHTGWECDTLLDCLPLEDLTNDPVIGRATAYHRLSNGCHVAILWHAG